MTNNHAKVILNALCAGISNLETLEAITMAIKALDEMHQDLITAEEYAFSLKKQLAEKNAEIKTLKTLAKLGNMRANDYRVMRDRALKAESEVEGLLFSVQSLSGHLSSARAEAIKECLEWVLSLFPADKKFTTISRFAVKQKLKEMVGERE